MKPWQSLVFVISVFLLLGIVSFIFPDRGWFLTQNTKIRFVKIQDILHPEKVEYADISNIVQNTDSLIGIEELNIQKQTPPPATIKRDTIRASATNLRSNVYKLQYPDGNKEILYPLFQILQQLKNNHELIRIMHYGDSQIEGDRISSGIRSHLQQRFGGKGPGLFQLVDITKTIAIERKSSPGWIRYIILDQKNHNPRHKKYGALLSFCRFSPYLSDSSVSDTSHYHASLTLHKSPLTYQNTRDFDQMRLFYGYNEKPFSIKLFNGEEKQLAVDSLPPRNSATTLVWNFEESPKELLLEFYGTASPDIYGIALDGKEGVAVDNVALRGSAGLDFTKTDMSFLAKMYSYLNVKLLILEFGVNVVPNVVDNYDYYERWFYGNLDALKRFNPDLSIIVIGLSDMARKTEAGDFYESYPNIEKIRDAQRNAAFRAGCAFWDLYQAMGGKNSMPSWVFATPPLAAKDFTHFNVRGSKIISQMFYNALIADYEEYLEHEK